MDYGSPAENQNKGYAKQEKKDLLNDNPIAKDASGGRPMILKHMSGSKGSPLMKHTKAQGEKLNPRLVSAIHMHDDFTKKNNIKHK
jgi:hypothetical protein